MCNAHTYIHHSPARQEDFFPSWSNTHRKTLKRKGPHTGPIHHSMATYEDSPMGSPLRVPYASVKDLTVIAWALPFRSLSQDQKQSDRVSCFRILPTD